MAVGTIAMIGVSLFSAYLGSQKQREANNARKKAQTQQLQLAEAEYALRAERVQKWNEMYGSVERNMVEYVKNLDASDVYRKAEGSIKAKFDQARASTVSILADRGLDVAGGVTADALTQISNQEAETKILYQQKVEADIQASRQNLISNNRRPQDPSIANQSNMIGAIGETQALAFENTSKQYDKIGEALTRGINKFENRGKVAKTPETQGTTTWEGGTQVTTTTADAYTQDEYGRLWEVQ